KAPQPIGINHRAGSHRLDRRAGVRTQDDPAPDAAIGTAHAEAALYRTTDRYRQAVTQAIARTGRGRRGTRRGRRRGLCLSTWGLRLRGWGWGRRRGWLRLPHAPIARVRWTQRTE